MNVPDLEVDKQLRLTCHNKFLLQTQRIIPQNATIL